MKVIYVDIDAIFSRPFTRTSVEKCDVIPPMNRWAIVIRRLRRLLRQSRVSLIDVDDAALKRDSYGVGAIVRAKF